MRTYGIVKGFDVFEHTQSSIIDSGVHTVADASHELRTPVAVILTQAEHSLSRPRSSEEYCSALDTCLRAARRMRRLVDDLLLLSQADSGRLKACRTANDLADIVRAALAGIEPLSIEHQVQVASQLQAAPILCDEQQIAQVVTNLVTNALQYNRPGGQVFLTVQTSPHSAVLRIADTGIGIAIADQPQIFERFYRADRARTHREGQGTGLGLSIVTEIVAAHDGTIEVFSTPDEGTTSTVKLPLVSSAASP